VLIHGACYNYQLIFLNQQNPKQQIHASHETSAQLSADFHVKQQKPEQLIHVTHENVS
jgi:hypothetical protein